MSFIQIENRAGPPIQSGDTRLVPISRALILHLPGSSGGLVWNRPTAVSVQMENGPEHVLPVQDVTRQTQIAILAAAMFGGLFMWLLTRMIKRSQPTENSLQEADGYILQEDDRT